MELWTLIFAAVAATGVVATWVQGWYGRARYDFEMRVTARPVALTHHGGGEWIAEMKSNSNRAVGGVMILTPFPGIEVFPSADVAVRLAPGEVAERFSFDVEESVDDAWVIVMWQPVEGRGRHLSTWLPLSQTSPLRDVRLRQMQLTWWRKSAVQIASRSLSSPWTGAFGRGAIWPPKAQSKTRRSGKWWRARLVRLGQVDGQPPMLTD